MAEIFEGLEEAFDDVLALSGLIIDFLTENLVDVVDVVEDGVVAGLFGLC